MLTKRRVMECPFSDHDLVESTFGIFTEGSGRIESKVVARRDFKNFSVDQFQQLLLNSDISSLEGCDSVDGMFSKWSGTLIAALNSLAPVKLSCPRRHSCHFMTAELLGIIKARKRLYTLLQQPDAGHSTLFPEYRRLRNKGNNLYRQLRNRFFSVTMPPLLS